MANNKSIRQALEIIYGKGCMFKKANIEPQIEQMKTIKTFKQFIVQKHYTRKQVKKYGSILTLHHLIHRSEGGETSVNNGAEISELAHMYLHSLPRDEEEVINNMLRKYKRENYQRCSVVIDPDLSLPFDIDTLELTPTEDSIEIKKFSRAKQKQETKRMIDRYYSELDDEDDDYDRWL